MRYRGFWMDSTACNSRRGFLRSGSTIPVGAPYAASTPTSDSSVHAYTACSSISSSPPTCTYTKRRPGPTWTRRLCDPWLCSPVDPLTLIFRRRRVLVPLPGSLSITVLLLVRPVMLHQASQDDQCLLHHHSSRCSRVAPSSKKMDQLEEV